MKHCIIVKFIDGYNWQAQLDDIKKIFDEALKIEGIKKIDYLLTNTNLENRSHLAIIISMDNKDALVRFKPSACHMLWKEKYTPFILNKTIFDYDD